MEEVISKYVDHLNRNLAYNDLGLAATNGCFWYLVTRTKSCCDNKKHTSILIVRSIYICRPLN